MARINNSDKFNLLSKMLKIKEILAQSVHLLLSVALNQVLIAVFNIMESHMKTIPTSILLYTIAIVLLISTGYSLAQNGFGDEMSWEQTEITATVVKVMPESGMVTLQGNDGQIWTLSVGQDVDLQNLNSGDKVDVTLFQGQALEVREPTEQDRQNPFVVVDRVQPPEGVNPTAGALRQIRALMTVTNIDRSNSTITVEGPAGNSYVLKVKDDSLLDRLQSGQQFVVIFTEGIVAEIQKQ